MSCQKLSTLEGWLATALANSIKNNNKENGGELPETSHPLSKTVKTPELEEGSVWWHQTKGYVAAAVDREAVRTRDLGSS